MIPCKNIDSQECSGPMFFILAKHGYVHSQDLIAGRTENRALCKAPIVAMQHHDHIHDEFATADSAL